MDYGCYAPAVVFVEVFKRRGVEITMEQTRRPMGLKKLDHIRAISQQDEVAALWKKVHGKACTEADVQDMFEKDFGRRTTETKKLEIDGSSWYCVNNKTFRIEQFEWSVNLT